MSHKNRTGKDCDHKDGLDSLLEECAVFVAPHPSSDEKMAPDSNCMNVTEEDEWDDWETTKEPILSSTSDCSSSPLQPTLDEARVKFFQGQLQKYIQDLADPYILQEIESDLAKKHYKDFIEYFTDKPHMAQYTLDHELTRMSYKLVRSSGAPDRHHTYQDDMIVESYQRNSRKDSNYQHGPVDFSVSNPTEGNEFPVPKLYVLAEDDPASIRAIHAICAQNLTWRFANQILFADMLETIQRRFFRADLEVGVVSRDSKFVVDVDADSMEGTAIFHISLAGGTDGPVEVARLQGRIKVEVKKQCLVQCVKLMRLLPVFDDTLARVASALVKHEHGAQEGREGEEGGWGWKTTSHFPLTTLKKEMLAAGEGLMQAVTTVGKVLEEVAAEAALDERLQQGKGPESPEESCSIEEELKGSTDDPRRGCTFARGSEKGGGIVHVARDKREKGREGGQEGGRGPTGALGWLQASESMLEGVVGGLGSLIGASGSQSGFGFHLPRGARVPPSPFSSKWVGAGSGGNGEEELERVQLYRREGEGEREKGTEVGGMDACEA